MVTHLAHRAATAALPGHDAGGAAHLAVRVGHGEGEGDTPHQRQVGQVIPDAGAGRGLQTQPCAEPLEYGELVGDALVHVAGVLPGTAERADITSNSLAFDTNEQIVATREPVTLVMSGRTLDANGMVANLKERRVQLESDVHGSFHN